jgi:hypothetical protein
MIFVELILYSSHTNILLSTEFAAYIVLFVLTKMDKDKLPTIDCLATVIPLRFQAAVGQNFG